MGKALGPIGAIGGAALGSVVPGVGTALGAQLGGALGGALSGQKARGATRTTSRQFSPELQAALSRQLKEGERLSQLPYKQFGGQRVAGFTPDELQAFGITRGQIGQATPDIQEAQGIARQVAQRGLGGIDPTTLQGFMDPYLQNVMDISRSRQLDQFDLAKRQLQQQEGQIGAFGGSRSALAEAQLRDNFSRQLAEQEARQLSEGFRQAQGLATQGLGVAGQAGTNLANLAMQKQQAGLTDVGALLSQGGLQRGQNQQGLDVAYQDFLTAQNQPFERLKFGANIANAQAGLAPITHTGTPAQASGVSKGLGLGSMLGSTNIFQNGGLFGTRAGTPMSGGFQGPTQGSGILGGLSRFTSSLGFKEGGQVPIQGYANGGQVSDRPIFEDLFRQGLDAVPGSFSLDNPLLQSILSANQTAGKTLMSGLQGLADFADPVTSVIAKRARDPRNLPTDIGLGLVGGPIASAVASKVAPALGAAKSVPGITKELGNLALRHPSIAAALGLTAQAAAGKDTQPAPTAQPVTAQDILTQAPGSQFVDPQMAPQPQGQPMDEVMRTTQNTQAPELAKQSVQQGGLSVINEPLFAFGASLLNSGGKDIYQALGEGAQAYMHTQQTKEDRIKEIAAERLKQDLELFRARTGRLQAEAQAKASAGPLAMELKRLKIKQAEKELGKPLAQFSEADKAALRLAEAQASSGTRNPLSLAELKANIQRELLKNQPKTPAQLAQEALDRRK